MAKSREKTQQIGFWDSEVSKADHDTVCIWAYENADAILRATYPEIFDVSWRKDEIDLDFATMDQDEVNKARELLSLFLDQTRKLLKKLSNSFSNLIPVITKSMNEL
jgi:hypothetical protein